MSVKKTMSIIVKRRRGESISSLISRFRALAPTALIKAEWELKHRRGSASDIKDLQRKIKKHEYPKK